MTCEQNSSLPSVDSVATPLLLTWLLLFWASDEMATLSSSAKNHFYLKHL